MKVLMTLVFIIGSLMSGICQEKVFKVIERSYPDGIFPVPQTIGFSAQPPSDDNRMFESKSIWGNISFDRDGYFLVYRADQIDSKLQVVLDSSRNYLRDSVGLLRNIFNNSITNIDTSLRSLIINSIDSLRLKLLTEEVKSQIKNEIELLINEKITALRKELQDQIDDINSRIQ